MLTFVIKITIAGVNGYRQGLMIIPDVHIRKAKIVNRIAAARQSMDRHECLY